MTRVIAHGADFHDATLRAASLTYGRFEKANFHNAILELAVLMGGNFDGADFKDADMHRTQIGDADLSHAHGLVQDQLDDACANSRTRVPSGLGGQALLRFGAYLDPAYPGDDPGHPGPAGPAGASRAARTLPLPGGGQSVGPALGPWSLPRP